MTCEFCGVGLPGQATGRTRRFCGPQCAEARRRDLAELGKAVEVVARHDLVVAKRREAR